MSRLPAGPTSSLFEDEDAATPSLAGRLHVTLGHERRRFAAGEVAPAGLHWCLAPEAGPTVDLGPDGLARHGLIPEIDLPRRMWGGVVIDASRPIRVGDHVVRRSQVAAPVRKTGRTGPLAFCAISNEYEVGGEIALRETQTIAYRAAVDPEESVDAPAPAPKRGELRRVVPIDAAQLFRFSALTFNAHRIHLDRDFARHVEGYGDILVHGTYTAALMLDVAFATSPSPRAWQATIRALAAAPCRPLEIWVVETEPDLLLEAFSHETRIMTATIRR